MSDIGSLSDRNCKRNQGTVFPLNHKEISDLLEKLSFGWRLDVSGALCKSYEFDNFKDAMEFANKVALIADQQNHHPDLQISWGKCCVKIWTHEAGGLTENDFILAAKIDR